MPEEEEEKDEVPDEEPLASFVKSKKKPQKSEKSIDSPAIEAQSVQSKGIEKAKFYKRKQSIPGSTIHCTPETEDVVDDVNPKQYQKIAKTTYETHLKKIEVNTNLYFSCGIFYMSLSSAMNVRHQHVGQKINCSSIGAPLSS